MADKWSRSAELLNQRGLHARASAAFAREASRFNARVSVHYDGMTVSAASIMDLLMLGARVGQVIDIEAEGPEAREALEAVCDLVGRKFDEKD
ncbi:MAG: HPr family phosphocarrier protein [Alphaproteobacteria bacterium 32-64-14]|nr:MAG: HPr family phosphocarrier protein [Alphaproteobacteria bacterium 32-64-14]